MKVYTISYRLKVFILVSSILLILTFGSLLMVPFITLPPDSLALRIYDESLSTHYLFYLTPVLSLSAIIFGVILIQSAFDKKVVFTDEAIISKGIFVTKRLEFNEIKGFGINHFVLYIEANTNAKSRIAINLLSLNKADHLIQNLEGKFINLDFALAD
ncbi:hypothetical protein [Flavobacterium sp. 1355]|uniref:hypothetical protein n=1 Tax=Flavobacterium sp. 1355 TaxID=2806571 RepID=UPI001AE8BDFC|nr:hypothetical protein [Flavobacterium sp. 1355]MBP1222246.1 hypothetical protein [Flavobacterium sp. 1355]